MVCGQVLTPTNGGTPDVAVKGTDASSETPDLVDLRAKSRTAYTWLKQRKIRSFYSVLTSPSMRTGVQSLLQVSLMLTLTVRGESRAEAIALTTNTWEYEIFLNEVPSPRGLISHYKYIIYAKVS